MKKPLMKSVLFFCAILITPFLIQASEGSELKSKIEKLNEQFARDMIAGNYENVMQHYTDDAVSLPSYEPMLKGKEAIKKSSEQMANSPMKIESFEFETVSVEEQGDIVIEVGKYKLGMKNTMSGENWNDNGKYLTIWEHKNGELKIKYETWNSDNNPWMEMEQMKEMEMEELEEEM